jgi:single-strand DNA-binding protein
MIKMQVIGNLGRDAEINTVGSNTVINFNVAHTEKWKDAQGNQKDKTTWVQCAYWTEKTGIAPYLKKGTSVYVEGQPEAKEWESNGKHGVNLNLRVGMVQLLGSAPERQEQPAQPQQQAAPQNVPVESLPF